MNNAANYYFLKVTISFSIISQNSFIIYTLKLEVLKSVSSSLNKKTKRVIGQITLTVLRTPHHGNISVQK